MLKRQFAKDFGGNQQVATGQLATTALAAAGLGVANPCHCYDCIGKNDKGYQGKLHFIFLLLVFVLARSCAICIQLCGALAVNYAYLYGRLFCFVF